MSKPAPLSRTKYVGSSRAVSAELDFRLLGLAGELPGVAEQVLEHDAQQPASASADEPVLDLELDGVRSGSLPLKLVDDLARERREVDRSGD